MLFPFVELVFTHGLGPAPGRYVVRPPGAPVPAPGEASVIGPTLAPGSADVLVIRVEGAPSAKRRIRRRRPTAVAAQAPDAEVPLYVATLVYGTRAFDDEAAAEEAIAGWREDPATAWALAGEALAVVNRAIRAYRAAAADPYVVEVIDGDPRTTRVGYGAAGVIEGDWIAALDLPRPRGPRVARAEQLRPVGMVADVLAGRESVLGGEDVLLRAVLDFEQGRPVVAARQLVLALELLAEAPGMPAERLRGLAGSTGVLLARLTDPATSEAARQDLGEALTTAGDLVDRWHAG